MTPAIQLSCNNISFQRNYSLKLVDADDASSVDKFRLDVLHFHLFSITKTVTTTVPSALRDHRGSCSGRGPQQWKLADDYFGRGILRASVLCRGGTQTWMGESILCGDGIKLCSLCGVNRNLDDVESLFSLTGIGLRLLAADAALFEKLVYICLCQDSSYFVKCYP